MVPFLVINDKWSVQTCVGQDYFLHTYVYWVKNWVQLYVLNSLPSFSEYLLLFEKGRRGKSLLLLVCACIHIRKTNHFLDVGMPCVYYTLMLLKSSGIFESSGYSAHTSPSCVTPSCYSKRCVLTWFDWKCASSISVLVKFGGYIHTNLCKFTFSVLTPKNTKADERFFSRERSPLLHEKKK